MYEENFNYVILSVTIICKQLAKKSAQYLSLKKNNNNYNFWPFEFYGYIN